MLTSQREIRGQVQMAVDACLFGLGLYLAHLVRRFWQIEIFGGAREIEPFSEYVWLMVLVVPAAPLLLRAQGFYRRPMFSSRRAMLWQLGKACGSVVIGLILVLFLMRRGALVARSVVMLFGVISFLLIIGKEELVRFWRRTSLGQAQLLKKVILVGTTDDTARLRNDLARSQPEGLRVVGHLNINEGPVDRLVHLMHDTSANGVILTAAHTYFGQLEQAIEVCEREGVEVWLLADFFKTQVSRVNVDKLLGRPMLVFRSGPDVSWPALAKHALDFVGAFVLLAVLSLPMTVVALLIRVTSPGPVLFRQQRSGLNGQPFTMLKFRSMQTDAEQRKHELDTLNEMTGPVFKVTNDPRITPLGTFLRRYSIDEWPQLINVLRGEMSLVGPRPLPVDETLRFNDLAHRRRLSVKPGLTCLWQVSGRNNVRDFREWVRLDLEYIDNWSLWLDIKILIRTIPAVFAGTGAK